VVEIEDDTLIRMFEQLPKKFDNFDEDFSLKNEEEFYRLATHQRKKKV